MANEILLMAEVLSSEKNVDKQVIFEAIEAALSTATRKRNREDIGVRVAIEQTTGEYESFRQWEVIADDEEEDQQIIPNSQPPEVPEDGTYIDALNEAGVDPQRIEQL